MTVMLSPLGQTAVFKGGQQVAELQEPWILLYGKFLESKGVDPLSVTLDFIGNRKGRFQRNDDGSLTWSVEP